MELTRFIFGLILGLLVGGAGALYVFWIYSLNTTLEALEPEEFTPTCLAPSCSHDCDSQYDYESDLEDYDNEIEETKELLSELEDERKELYSLYIENRACSSCECDCPSLEIPVSTTSEPEKDPFEK